MKQKFKVEMVIEVEYEKVEGLATTTCTTASCLINNPTEVIVFLDNGSIQYAEIKKFEGSE